MIREGSHVTIHYVLKVDGQEIESSRIAGPTQYTHGQNQLLPELEEQLVGLEEGQRKRVAIEPDKAYGQPDPEAVRSFPRSAFQNLDAVSVGEMVQGTIGTKEFQATIVGVDDEQVVLDMNHPLAGQTLEYDVEVVKID